MFEIDKYRAIKRVATHIRVSSNPSLEDLERRLLLEPRDVSMRASYLRACQRQGQSPDLYLDWVKNTYNLSISLEDFVFEGPVEDLQWMAGVTFPNLEELHLDYSKLTSLEGLGEANLPNLRYIGFSNNQITSVDELRNVNLSSVHRISFASNQIMEFPEGLNAPDLIQLVLDKNNIDSIFPFISLKAPQLNTLDLKRNSIKSLKGLERCNFPDLTYLNLQGNPISDLEASVDSLVRFCSRRTETIFISVGPKLKEKIRKIMDDQILDGKLKRDVVSRVIFM